MTKNLIWHLCLFPFLRNQVHLTLQEVEERAGPVGSKAWIRVTAANPHTLSTLSETSSHCSG